MISAHSAGRSAKATARFREPGRTIIKQGNVTVIRRDESDRFRYGARNMIAERRGNELRTIAVWPDARLRRMSAMPSMATEFVRRNEPNAMCQEATYALQQTAPLFDHLVGEREELCRHIEPERFGCLEIDH